MTLLLPFLLLTTPPEYDGPDYCTEVTQVILEAVKDKVLSDKQAQEMIGHCWTNTP